MSFILNGAGHWIQSFMHITCGGLSKDGFHKLTGNGTIRRYSLVEVGMALLEEVYHWGVSFEVSDAQATPSVILSSCFLPIQM